MAKVVAAMSGGVDSSVCAYLLKQQGYEVIGATMQIWQDDSSAVEREGSCCGASAVEDARRVAQWLDIPYYVMNFREDFSREVIDRFCAGYLEGITPNPCIMCNRYIKWGAFLERCRAIGADYIATGHYARIIRLPSGRLAIRRSVSAGKDQTYVLYSMTQEELAATLLPVGEYEKTRIREIAREAGLPTATRKDSQDICFIPDGRHERFLKEHTGTAGKSGRFLDLDGNVLGMHDGTAAFTIGQRKGLGIAAGRPVYVCRIDAAAGDVYVSDEETLFKREIIVDDLHYMGEERFEPDAVYMAKVRYSQKLVPCHVRYLKDDKLCVTFEDPVRAPTPGQAAVLYRDDWIAGGGTIVEGK